MPFTCSICTANFGCDDSVNATICGHVFHVQCLQQWSNVSSSCPMCRSQFNIIDARMLYFSLGSVEDEDGYLVHLQHFKNGIQRLLHDQDKEIESLKYQLSVEKKAQKEVIKKKLDRAAIALKRQLRDEFDENEKLKLTNRDLLNKVKALEKQACDKNTHLKKSKKIRAAKVTAAKEKSNTDTKRTCARARDHAEKSTRKLRKARSERC